MVHKKQKLTKPLIDRDRKQKRTDKQSYRAELFYVGCDNGGTYTSGTAQHGWSGTENGGEEAHNPRGMKSP